VKESARERKILKNIARHLIHPLSFVFPLYKGDSNAKYGIGFLLFDKLANVARNEHHNVLTSEEVRAYAPNRSDSSRGGLVFNEYTTEDARFTLMNALSAVEYGALIANHAKQLLYNLMKATE